MNKQLSEIDPMFEDAGLPGIRAAEVYADETGTNVMYFEFAPGAEVDLHTHDESYYAVLVSGQWHRKLDDGTEVYLEPGAFVLQPGGQAHYDNCSSEERCIAVAFRKAPRTYTPMN